MNEAETRNYLHSKLQAAGGEEPAEIFPEALCRDLFEASGGWPGIVDRVALLALAKADSIPIEDLVIEKPVLPNGTWNAQALEEAAIELGEPPKTADH